MAPLLKAAWQRRHSITVHDVLHVVLEIMSFVSNVNQTRQAVALPGSTSPRVGAVDEASSNG